MPWRKGELASDCRVRGIRSARAGRLVTAGVKCQPVDCQEASSRRHPGGPRLERYRRETPVPSGTGGRSGRSIQIGIRLAGPPGGKAGRELPKPSSDKGKPVARPGGKATGRGSGWRLPAGLPEKRGFLPLLNSQGKSSFEDARGAR